MKKGEIYEYRPRYIRADNSLRNWHCIIQGCSNDIVTIHGYMNGERENNFTEEYSVYSFDLYFCKRKDVKLGHPLTKIFV